MDIVNRNQENMDEVLVKYLLGEATDAEHAEVEQWIGAAQENKRYFEHFRLIWDESKKLVANSTVDENEAWGRFMQRVEREEQPEVVVPKTRSIPLGRSNWMRVAAILIMLVGCGTLYYFVAGPGSMITTQAGSVAMVATLPDGSTVTLNKNSSVTYPAKFAGNTRHVTLKGEGFFNVTPDKSKPFIIDADNSSIKVVGTSFNVKSNSERTEVIVETGIVEVAKTQYAIRVSPHQKATVLKDKAEPVMERNTDDLYNYYRSKEFVCSNTPLYKLTDILGEAFDKHITIANEQLKNKPYDGTFHSGESLDAILEVVTKTVGATIEQRGDEIILR